MADLTAAEEFVNDFLAHARSDYDPAKRRERYLRTRKLKGRKKGEQEDVALQTPGSNNRRAAVSNMADSASRKLSPEKAMAVRRLADVARQKLIKLTEEIETWRDKNPKATDAQRAAKRDEIVSKKDKIVNDLKAEVARLISQSSTTTKNQTAPEGRRH